MKIFKWFIVVSVLWASCAFAAETFYNFEGYSCWDSGAVTGDVSTAVPFGLGGKYLMSYHIVTSADDAVTLTILHPDGATLAAITTTAATSGEFSKFAGFPFLSAKGYSYTITNVSSGTTTLEICGANQ